MTTTDERSDIEKLVECLAGTKHPSECGGVRFATASCGYPCSCGLTEARDLAKRVEEELREHCVRYNKAGGRIHDLKAKLSTAEAERDEAREKMKLLRDVAAELWGQRDLWDESPTRFLAWVHNQTGKEAVRGMKAEAERDTLRARVEELEKGYGSCVNELEASGYYHDHPSLIQHRAVLDPPADTGEEG